MFIKNCYEQSGEMNDYLYWYSARITSCTHSSLYGEVDSLNDEYHYLNKKRFYANSETTVRKERAHIREEDRELLEFLKGLHDN